MSSPIRSSVQFSSGAVNRFLGLRVKVIVWRVGLGYCVPPEVIALSDVAIRPSICPSICLSRAPGS